MVKLPVYLDNSATTPCDPAVLEAMLPYFSTHFGNASSRTHPFGRTAENAVKTAREEVAALIHAEPNEIVFTSGATESVNLAIKGVFEAYRVKGNHIITTKIEHKAVLDTCHHLAKSGAEITYLDVDRNGLPDLQQLESAIQPGTILIAMMMANNELGTILPYKQISRIARANNILFFTDATQAIGKIPVDVMNDGMDLLCFSAHKMYGPKGAGALYVRRKNPRVKLIAQMDGGGHEKGMRSGTLNVPAIVGLGKAAVLSMKLMEQESLRLRTWRDRLQEGLLDIEESSLNGDPESRLPHVLNISFKYAEAEQLMMQFNHLLAISSGSACTSATMEPSYVLKAIGLTDEAARSSLRFSLGRFNEEEQIGFVIDTLKKAVESIRSQSQKWTMYRQGISIDE